MESVGGLFSQILRCGYYLKSSVICESPTEDHHLVSARPYQATCGAKIANGEAQCFNLVN